MTKAEKMPIPGIPQGFTEEELLAERQRVAEEKKKIIEDLNKIKFPLSVTVFAHNQPWTIRNIEFWKQLEKRDKDMYEFMVNYLIEQK